MMGNDTASAQFKQWWEQDAVGRGSRLVYNTGRAMVSVICQTEHAHWWNTDCLTAPSKAMVTRAVASPAISGPTRRLIGEIGSIASFCVPEADDTTGDKIGPDLKPMAAFAIARVTMA